VGLLAIKLSASMPVQWGIRDGILKVAVLHDWSGGGPATAVAAAMSDARFQPGTSLMFDVRMSNANSPGDEIRERTEWMADYWRRVCHLDVRSSLVKESTSLVWREWLRLIFNLGAWNSKSSEIWMIPCGGCKETKPHKRP
jgi:hypothetical protein